MTATATYRQPDTRAAKRARVAAWASKAATSLLIRVVANPRNVFRVLRYNRHDVDIEYTWIEGDFAVPLHILQRAASYEIDRRLPPKESE